jgi:diketogulonate reductase-like aldo/keto reductase
MREERDVGRTRLLGISNVSLRHLLQMATGGGELPVVVQNRCYARLGWDRAVRQFCRENTIIYQGFSLLTANQEVLNHPLIAGLAASASVTPAQVVFSFARSAGILPLTGTSDAEHMRQDLASRDVALPAEAVHVIECLAG